MVNGYTGPLVHGNSEPRDGNAYGGAPRGENPYGADQATGRVRTGGQASIGREEAVRTPAAIREEVRLLLQGRNPEAALWAAARYLQEGDRIFAEAAYRYNEAQRAADYADMDHAEAAAGRKRIADEWRELERSRRALEVRAELLDRAYAELDAREAALEARECELRKKGRRRPDAAPVPELLDTGPQDLRPDPGKARTPAEFVQALSDLRDWRGNRPLRAISDACGNHISASTVGNILRGAALPDRLDVVDAFVIGCGGSDQDRAEFASAWRRLRRTPLGTTLTDIPAIGRQLE